MQMVQYSLMNNLTTGILIPTLTPLQDDGSIAGRSVSDQARRLSRVKGVGGVLANAWQSERSKLLLDERIEIIARTKGALAPDQCVMAFVGTLNEKTLEEIDACCRAGASGVITEITLPTQPGRDSDFQNFINTWVSMADKSCLPIIVELDLVGKQSSLANVNLIEQISRSSSVVGVRVATHDRMQIYDQAYYTAKTIDRPFDFLTSSESALFHNLNTGADGVISDLAYIAPHEVAALYRNSRNGRSHDAQAIHDRLEPLTMLLSDLGAGTREMAYRELAHERGLLASTNARGKPEPLPIDFCARVHKTLDEIALKPISWI